MTKQNQYSTSPTIPAMTSTATDAAWNRRLLGTSSPMVALESARRRPFREPFRLISGSVLSRFAVARLNPRRRAIGPAPELVDPAGEVALLGSARLVPERP